MAVTLIPHTTYIWDDLTETTGEDSGILVVTCDNGYKFDGDITLHSNSSGTDYPATSQTDTVVRFEQKYVNSDWVVKGKVISTGGGTPELEVTNYVANTTATGEKLGAASAKVTLTANEGFTIQSAQVVFYNDRSNPTSEDMTISEGGKTATWQNDNCQPKKGVSISGETISGGTPELKVTNYVANTTATGEKLGAASAKVTLTANEGFTIQSAQVVFYNDRSNPTSEDMTISEGGKTATWQNDNCQPNKGVSISGETISGGTTELNVTNNITNTLNESHTYDGETATFTVESQHYPEYRFIDPKVNYTGTDGQPKSVDMEVEVLSYYSLATATVTDLDPTQPVTLTGKFTKVISIETNLSNCHADPPLPEFLQYGETLNVTLKANENTAFDTEQSTPNFFYYNDRSNPTVQNLTVSEDKQTATGSIVIQNDWHDFSVNAQAYPVTVVGEQYGAINVYLVTLDELAEFSGKRFFKGTDTDPENIDLGAYVNRIRRIYTSIGASSTDVIRCGNYNTGVSCHQPAQDKITLDFGTAVVPAHNEDNTDYESEIQIFLPFAGFVNLNNAYAGKTIALQYIINVVTGNGVALLSCNGVVFQVEETEPSSEIIYLSPSDQVKTVGGDDWNEMLYYGLEPYIYCKWYESASNGRNNDRQTGEIGDFRGFNVFDDVTPIHTAEMLTEEQELIYTALSDGVYIE